MSKLNVVSSLTSSISLINLEILEILEISLECAVWEIGDKQ